MSRFTLAIALVFAVACASPAAGVVTPATDGASKEKLDGQMNMASHNILPRVSEPQGLNACYCLKQGADCSPILAASSGVCVANKVGRLQPDICVLRCAGICFHKSRSLGICRALRVWLNQKVFKILRAKNQPLIREGVEDKLSS